MRLIRYLVTGLLCGASAGLLCVLFYRITELANSIRTENGFLLYFLPLSGVMVVFLYRRFDRKGRCSSNEIFTLYENTDTPPRYIAPLIFISVPLAYLTGGSVGRVGPSFQLAGGGLLQLGRLRESARFGRFIPDNDVLCACGVAAGFSVILDAPAAGAVVGAEIFVLRKEKLQYIIATLASAYAGYAVSHGMHTVYADLGIEFSDKEAEALRSSILSLKGIVLVLVLAVSAALIGAIYCYSRRLTEKVFEHLFPNEYVRVIAGAVIIIAVVKLLGTFEYCTPGISEAGEALKGKAEHADFFFKLLLTCITLGCGFRGGDVAPVIYIGASLGCVLGMVTGFSPSAAAAIVMTGALVSVTNCTVGIFVFACEAVSLRPEMCAMFAVSAAVCHIISGQCSLFDTQDTRSIKGKLNIP